VQRHKSILIQLLVLFDVPTLPATAQECLKALLAKFGSESVRVGMVKGMAEEMKGEWEKAQTIYAALETQDGTNVVSCSLPSTATATASGCGCCRSFFVSFLVTPSSFTRRASFFSVLNCLFFPCCTVLFYLLHCYLFLAVPSPSRIKLTLCDFLCDFFFGLPFGSTGREATASSVFGGAGGE
jgi:hypothetical protein